VKRIINIMLCLILLSLAGCIFINPTTLDFDSDETTKTFTLTIIGDVGWSINYSESWLMVEPDSGQGTTTVNVTVNRAGLEDGSYEATLTISTNPNVPCPDVVVKMTVGGDTPSTTTITPTSTTTSQPDETSTTTSQPDDEEDPTLTGWRMEAQLVVRFVCKLPPIDETATITLSGYENGDVIGENGFFVYYEDADFCNGGNYHRDGQWDINPYGRMVIHNGGHWLELNENTYHIDNIIIECPPGTTQPPIQEDGTWNEGLFMQLVDGANNTITNEAGDEISWTLQGVAEIEMIE
jgi:hypothetical protein